MQHVGGKFPNQEWNPRPLHWERRLLATGPPGKSPDNFYQYISLLVFPTGVGFDKHNQTSYRQNSRFVLSGVSLLKVLLS